MQNNHSPLRIKKSLKKSKKIKYHRVILLPFLIFTIGLVLIPMIFIVLNAFSSSGEIYRLDLTLENFIFLIENRNVMSNVFLSLRLALVATFFTILIAYPLALWISKRKPGTQAILVLLITAPMWLNMLLRLFALRQVFQGILLTMFQFFGFSGNIYGTNLGIVIAMVYIYLPFMLLPIYAFLSKMDTKLIEASMDLGGSKAETFRKVIWPLSIPGILSGITVVLLGTATTVVIPMAVGRNINLIGNIIERSFLDLGDWFLGSALGVIVLVLMLLLMWIISKLDRKRVMA